MDYRGRGYRRPYREDEEREDRVGRREMENRRRGPAPRWTPTNPYERSPQDYEREYWRGGRREWDEADFDENYYDEFDLLSRGDYSVPRHLQRTEWDERRRSDWEQRRRPEWEEQRRIGWEERRRPEWEERRTPGWYDRGYDYDYEEDPSRHYYRTVGAWEERGPYTGVGPKGYRRSDERIREDIQERLMWHGRVDATEIDVEVKDGEVTLNGTVSSRREKRMAEDAAEDVSGVVDVHNRLSVRERGETMQTRGYGTQTAGRSDIRQNMRVEDSQGEYLGTVKEVRGNDFILDRAMGRDLYIPFSATRAEGGMVRLNVKGDEIENQGWEHTEIL